MSFFAPNRHSLWREDTSPKIDASTSPLQKPKDFPTYDEIKRAHYRDKIVEIEIPPHRVKLPGKKQFFERSRKWMRVTLKVAAVRTYLKDKIFNIVRETAAGTNAGRHMYWTLEMAKKVRVACNGRVGTFVAKVSTSGKVLHFAMGVQKHTPLAELMGKSGTLGCQNMVLALEGVDMKHTGTGRHAHQGDHIQNDPQFNFSWELRRIPAFLNQLRKSNFDSGVSTSGNRCCFYLPLFNFVREVMEKRGCLEPSKKLPETFRILEVYKWGGAESGAIGVYTSPEYGLLDQVKYLRRRLGRTALRYLKWGLAGSVGSPGFSAPSPTHHAYCFTESRPSTTPGVAHTSSCYDEVFNTWEPPQSRRVLNTSAYLIDRFERGDFDANPAGEKKMAERETKREVEREFMEFRKRVRQAKKEAKREAIETRKRARQAEKAAKRARETEKEAEKAAKRARLDKNRKEMRELIKRINKESEVIYKERKEAEARAAAEMDK